MTKDQPEALQRQWPRSDWVVSRSTCPASVLVRKANATAEVASVGEAVDRFGVQLKAGDRVLLLDMPQWLIHDLPEDEQIELLGFVGKHGTVERVEREDLVWVGVGHTEDVDDQAYYSGHSFAIELANLKRA